MQYCRNCATILAVFNFVSTICDTRSVTISTTRDNRPAVSAVCVGATVICVMPRHSAREFPSGHRGAVGASREHIILTVGKSPASQSACISAGYGAALVAAIRHYGGASAHKTACSSDTVTLNC